MTLCARCMIDGSAALLEAIQAARPAGHAFPEPRVLIRGIIRSASVLTDMPMAKIVGKSRFKAEVRARQAIVWVALRATRQSTPEIGRRLGRDHTTILYASDRADVFYARNPDFAWLCERIWAAVEAHPAGPPVSALPEAKLDPEPKPVKPYRTVKVRREPGEYAAPNALDWKLESEPEPDETFSKTERTYAEASRALLDALILNHPERVAA